MRVDLAWCGEGQPYPDRTVASRIDGGLAINLAAPVDFLPCADAIADTEPHHSIIALQDAVRSDEERAAAARGFPTEGADVRRCPQLAGHGEKLSRHREAALAALLSEPTLAAAAKRSHVSERTLPPQQPQLERLDSIIFLTYDEHGGYYDHVKPAAADQGGADTPDGIQPGQCADLSNPPASQQVGGGADCGHGKTIDAPGICSDFSPTGAFPEKCATFDQLGFRVPLVAVSPFSKPHYVSHVVDSHTSFLALIEKRFDLQPLTARDANASDFEDMFDFDTSPSLNAAFSVAAPLPQQPPAVVPGDNGCPFTP